MSDEFRYDHRCIHAGGDRCDYGPEDCPCEEFEEFEESGFGEPTHLDWWADDE